MSDTPRTDALLIAWDFSPEPKRIIEHSKQLERDLEAWKEYAGRLEVAGDTLATVTLRNGRSHDQWHKAKETKP